MAALTPAPTPTVATGIPSVIWAAEHRESALSKPASGQGTAITGSVVLAAIAPARCPDMLVKAMTAA